MQTITIKAGKERPLLIHHPWVFSGAIESNTDIEHTGVFRIQSSDGHFIGWGWHDSKSHIPLRLLSWNEGDVIDDAFIRRAIAASAMRRSHFFGSAQTQTTAFRLICSEADFLPGLIVDAFGTLLSVTVNARFAWHHRDLIVQSLASILNPSMILFSVDADFAGIEQLKEATLYWKDGSWFTPSKRLDPIRFKESSLFYEVIAGTGQKSNFYCDRREIRTAVGRYAKDKTVLDLGSYTGSFTLHALRGGAALVDLVDTSSSALQQAKAHIAINEEEQTIPAGSSSIANIHNADMLEFLKACKVDHYDLIILDPPTLAVTKAQTDGALGSYQELNCLAMEKIRHNGIIATITTSPHIQAEMVRRMLTHCASVAHVEIQVLHQFYQQEDHPVRLSFAESSYLCGFLIRVLRF